MAHIAPVDPLGQKLQERLEIHGVELLRSHELPVDHAKLVLQLHHAAGHELLDALARFGEHAAIGGKTRRFQRKHEAVRCFIVPFGEGRRFLRTVIGAVDFDGSELARGIFELALLRKFLGIEALVPRFIGPAANADADLARLFPGHCLSSIPVHHEFILFGHDV